MRHLTVDGLFLVFVLREGFPDLFEEALGDWCKGLVFIENDVLLDHKRRIQRAKNQTAFLGSVDQMVEGQ